MRKAGRIGKAGRGRRPAYGKETAEQLRQNQKAGGEDGSRIGDVPELAGFFARIAAAHPDRRDVVMLCIGTDRSTGDAFGPLLGNRLLASGWPHVYGTLQEPCDANRFRDVVASLPKGKLVLAFDACLGKDSAAVGRYRMAEGPLRPAEAVGNPLPAVGDYSVAAIVAARSIKPYAALQSASLALVMELAAGVQQAIDAAWGLQTESLHYDEEQKAGLS